MATGCTAMLKALGDRAAFGHAFRRDVDQAGFPKGVFNLVNGDGAGVGSSYRRIPDVDMVSFTGSSRGGKLITKTAADTLKRVRWSWAARAPTSSSPMPSEKAMKYGAYAMLQKLGQSCNAPTRCWSNSRFTTRPSRSRRRSRTTHGRHRVRRRQAHRPVVSEMQFNKIQALIQKGIDEGARLVAGGTGRPDGLNRGYYRAPDGLCRCDQRHDDCARGRSSVRCCRSCPSRPRTRPSQLPTTRPTA